ncbi:peroxiredoxin-like family protein [Ktedonobacter robiniae]|uniref:thioredoxin-dependent peroxiredoxin n=1 Tax=Ktedonobacter robiniae TaxID=2778365 RepID=A0ABQ3UR46_9CHLR|nr:peroxiredoxin-like family protein [Ktedonobacter robiniae]GHO55185.1 alkyl hydroperoxide reductase [Ktedonobacter robiniae]
MATYDPMNTPLQQQIDAFIAQTRDQITASMREQLLRPIQQIIASSGAEKALKEGELAPDFTLPDALGRPVSLSDLLKQGPVVVTFYRGAWCPYCNLELRAYQQALPQLQALGASLVAISPQTPDQSLSLAEKNALTFEVLSDVGNQVAREYGLVFRIDEAVRVAYQQIGADLPAYNGDASWELPIPGTFLIDQSGKVSLAFVDPNFIHRLDPAIIIAQLKQRKGELSL